MSDAKASSVAAKAPIRPMPLSPHLQIWRWHITMLTSILHRATGIGLYVGALILTGWALSLAGGEATYSVYMGLLGSWLGRVVMFGLTVCIFYHMANGVRHLVWDSGKGFLPKTASFTAMVCIAFAVAASVVVWGIAALTGALGGSA
jgi:succinate dehydrogenase / fumarate reductase cytochrome b subunit